MREAKNKWIFKLYFDKNKCEFKVDKIIDIIIKIAEDKGFTKVKKSFENNKDTNNHYYIIIKA